MGIEKLKAVLNYLGNFDNKTLSGRIRFQKSIYLLGKMGLNLGYTHTIYHYGPYSSELAGDGFKIDENPNLLIADLSESDLKIINKFKDFISGNEDNVIWFEMAATIDYLYNKKGIRTKEEIFSILKERHDYFDNNEIFESVIVKLIAYNLIRDI